MTVFIFMLEAALTMYCWNYLADNIFMLIGTNINYLTALIVTLLFQNLTGVFKHQFYDWSATKSESFLIQIMARNPQAVKVFLEALVDRVKAHQEEEEEDEASS